VRSLSIATPSASLGGACIIDQIPAVVTTSPQHPIHIRSYPFFFSLLIRYFFPLFLSTLASTFFFFFFFLFLSLTLSLPGPCYALVSFAVVFLFPAQFLLLFFLVLLLYTPSLMYCTSTSNKHITWHRDLAHESTRERNGTRTRTRLTEEATRGRKLAQLCVISAQLTASLSYTTHT
jgi:hypothetical protein